MPRKGYYSPALRRDLIGRLYYAAKDLRVPMTVLNDRLVEAGLNGLGIQRSYIDPPGPEEQLGKVAERPAQ